MTITTVNLTVNGDRLNRNIAELAAIGQLPNGASSRVAFTPEDVQGRKQVQQWMEEAGMTTRVDAAGNLIGRYPGQNSDVPALATGSHIDTVPVAGHFDGCLGVLAGIEVVRTLKEHHICLQHPLEVIVFTDEESSVIGSKAMAGEANPNSEAYRRGDGTTIEDCLGKIGGDWSKLATAQRDRTEIIAFVELHVEQGGVLESKNAQIGVVQGIVGQYRFLVKIAGRANHAGTTPMGDRKDALVAAAEVILAVNRIGLQPPGSQVATVGYLKASPNASNTVADKVELTIDLRDLSQSHLEALIEQMRREFDAIAPKTNTEIAISQTLHILPTLATPAIEDAIEQIAQQLHLTSYRLPSRAGHDAQEIGRFADMGMIFVPSRNGISHSGDEYTSPEECTQGTNVLLQTFLMLDRLYSVIS
ncbi:MAG: Zn-dependent hydrolase [Spirulinaceae cyanobacterium]